MPLSASPSRMFRVSVRFFFQMRLAFLAVNGLIGISETRSASSSLNSIDRILNRRSEGGAPCGNWFSLSVRAE